MICLGLLHPHQNMNCHPDRSEAKWRDLLFSPPETNLEGKPRSSLCHPERSRGICSSLHRPPMLRESTNLTFVIPTGAAKWRDLRLKPNFQSAQNRQPDLTSAELSLVESADYQIEKLSGQLCLEVAQDAVHAESARPKVYKIMGGSQCSRFG
jgi:hypothetical protein